MSNYKTFLWLVLSVMALWIIGTRTVPLSTSSSGFATILLNVPRHFSEAYVSAQLRGSWWVLPDGQSRRNTLMALQEIRIKGEEFNYDRFLLIRIEQSQCGYVLPEPSTTIALQEIGYEIQSRTAKKLPLDQFVRYKDKVCAGDHWSFYSDFSFCMP